MRFGLFAAVVVAVAARSAAAQSGQLSTEQIVAAISEGTKSKQLLMANAGSDTTTQFILAVRGPYGRVVSFAADKKLKYQTITAHEVPRDLTGPYLEVIATPGKPSSGASAVTPPPTNIVIRRKGDNAPVAADKIESFRVEWDTANGARLESRGLRALFALSKVPQNGELEVTVVTREFERVYTFKEDERARMR
jgi:hypothetical protein